MIPKRTSDYVAEYVDSQLKVWQSIVSELKTSETDRTLLSTALLILTKKFGTDFVIDRADFVPDNTLFNIQVTLLPLGDDKISLHIDVGIVSEEQAD